MAWIVLFVAIVTGVSGTLSLKLASLGHKRWYIAVVAGYTTALTLLSVTLRMGLPLNIVYGIWTATGVALTATLGRLIFKEPLSRTMVLGIGMIITGVLLLELGNMR
ncbi:DMT family transporter [Arthrobacter russicus]|uniref:Small multidrug resistance pump n=1 Tax=Arthrobacter russicus TaxID=172040 RepID=A0ABU1J8Q5_9MICC|nr:SMR family transporter [Arthrobacter russicus]MDR6268796.1 small multidrug resistance pump [Arthrobacter russicus]